MAEGALTKSLLFLEQQRDDGIAIRADDLSVISRLINQVAWHRMSRCKQTPIEKYIDLHHDISNIWINSQLVIILSGTISKIN